MDNTFLQKSCNYSWFSGTDIIVYDLYKKYAESYLITKGIQKLLTFDYIRSPYIDAVINTMDNKKIKLYVTEGTLLRIYEIFYKLNLCTDICQCKFTYSKENIKRIKLISRDEENREIPVIFHINADSRVNAIAEYMSMFAVKFVILHELGHYLNGHCGYSRSVNQNKFTFHLNEPIHIKLSSKQSKALEVDADSYAACFLFQEMEELIKNDDYILSLVEGKIDVYRLFAAGIQGVCCLMGIDNKISNTHPKSSVRACLCIDGACRLINDNDYKDEIFKTIANVVSFFNTLNNVDKDKFVNDMVSYGREAKEIEDCWRKDMYYKVKQFALSYISNY
ncbi:M48 family metalloprotease [Vallitalea guaymasensis]|uniref:Uncharacterized protein n=1 Tax=Vallitalea guaymasensis TaxID=1185412 RepID=A0A8J8ME09_9FIRM|nr:hypothetical protein [Vallitalea guaymasensis]QUH31093.1 hypothetical protein HYG85_20080 [Vallitalea guaymasensis]